MTKSRRESRGPKSRVQSPKSKVKGRGPVVGIIIGHAGFPHALRRAAISIIPDSGALIAVSNGDQPAHELDRKLRQAADRHPDRSILIFADMFGTSCCHAGTRFKRIRPDIRMVCGVNLPMLVRFLQHRSRKSFSELVRLMRRTAREEARLG